MKIDLSFLRKRTNKYSQKTLFQNEQYQKRKKITRNVFQNKEKKIQNQKRTAKTLQNPMKFPKKKTSKLRNQEKFSPKQKTNHQK